MEESTALTPYGSHFTARRAFFSFMGRAFRIYQPGGALAFFVRQKAFKLREEITVFGDEACTRPMLKIQARSIMDIAATYDIRDASTGETIGAMRRKGLKSILRDEWAILGEQDVEIGRVIEDSGLLALIRRFLSNLIPQTFLVNIHGQPVGQIRQRFNPFILTYDVDFTADEGGLLDRRMGVAMTVLLLAIEGRQR